MYLPMCIFLQSKKRIFTMDVIARYWFYSTLPIIQKVTQHSRVVIEKPVSNKFEIKRGVRIGSSQLIQKEEFVKMGHDEKFIL